MDNKNSFTDDELEMMAHGNNPQSNAYRELLAFRKLANSPELPDGWILIPAKASLAHLKSIACRYRHDFYLLDDNQKDSALSVARQMYEEFSGQGFFTIPVPTTEK
jgi:hypothetical protein